MKSFIVSLLLSLVLADKLEINAYRMIQYEEHLLNQTNSD